MENLILHTFAITNCFDDCYVWNCITITVGRSNSTFKFKIPIPALKSSSCDIDKGSDCAELIKLAKLIIWDEAPIAHMFCFQALDRTLNDIMSGTRFSLKKLEGKLLYLVVILDRSYQLY